MTRVLSQGQAVGEFEILAVAGVGGMGVVYRARQRSLGRVVALKVIRDEVAETAEYRERFLREAHLAASVDHPHIVSVFEVNELEGRLMLALQWIDGEDLRSLLRSTRGLEAGRAVRVLSQLAGALDAIHGIAGLVHRDIKPSNVLIREVGGEDHSYLTDFGVAKRSDSVADLTATGAVVGTVDYMAPEQIKGARTDARTDVYALGCVLFEMLSGRVPYERENSVAKLFAHVSEPPPRLPAELARQYPSFGPVLEKAMAKDPAGRYVSAGDFARDAQAALHGMRYMGQPSIVATGPARPMAPPGATTLSHAPSPPTTAQPTAQATEPTAAGQPALYPPQPLPTPQPQPMYQTYPYPTAPPPAPARSGGGNSLALILLALVALAGVAAGVLAAAGVFSQSSTPAAATSTSPLRSAPGHHHRSSAGTPPPQTTPSTNPSGAPPASGGSGLQGLPEQFGYGLAASSGVTKRFANNAFYEYWHASGDNPSLPEAINVWSQEGRAYYVLSCAPGGGVVDCTGHNASGVPLDVRFTQHAVSAYTQSEAATYANSGKLGPSG